MRFGQPSKLVVRVRSPSPALAFSLANSGFSSSIPGTHSKVGPTWRLLRSGADHYDEAGEPC